MPTKSKVYTNLLSDKDRIKVRHVRHGHEVIDFSVQYEAMIKSRWRKIIRYDSAHGQPHRHIYSPNGVDYRQIINTQDYNQALTDALIIVKTNFKAMRERYIMALTNAERELI